MDYKNTLRKYLLPAVCAVTVLSASVAQAASTEMPAPANSKQVFFVGNNWDGTVTVIRPSGDFGKMGVVNMIPDRKERLLEIPLYTTKIDNSLK